MKEALQKVGELSLDLISNTFVVSQLDLVHGEIFGKKSALSGLMQNLKNLSGEEKAQFGKEINELKKSLMVAFDEKKRELEEKELLESLKDDGFDEGICAEEVVSGHLHPITQVQLEVEKIFAGMGFSVMDGPEVESEYYNFEGLNIPDTHPARDMQDTFFIADKFDEKHGRLVLRTHTSPVQIRTMEKYGAPLRLIVPGRVFRNEATDASHEHTFDQVEGLLIDKDISLANLKGVMIEFLSRLFKQKVKVRFRPGYFPFVEPGLELDFSCLLCKGKGCRTCKNTGWLEFMGAGMVHPNVLKAGGIDPNEYQGWAFGFGLTRLVMMLYEIDDIRHLTSGDMRFLKQF
jgi:phenylalanyl-tRNA synthetase alpha chain